MGVGGQFPLGSPLYVELSEFALQDLNYTVVTQGDPALIATYHPDLYLLPRNAYVLAPAVESLTQNILFDPCRNQPFSCCSDSFGTPEFESTDGSPTLPNGDPNPNYGVRVYQYSDGASVPSNALRRPPDKLVIDPSCTGVLQPPGRVDCVTNRIARRPWPSMPACWNYNDTVNAGIGCRSPLDGTPLPLCLELGYTQNAYIADCGGPYAGSEHCGTYLEVHRPGREEKLAEVRLPGVLTSGYRMTVISTTVKKNPDHVLCYDPFRAGQYEAWWVLRTLDGFNVQKRLPFVVISPLCDWDATNNKYRDYATVAIAKVLTGVDYFNRSLRLFTQPKINGSLGTPGVGMGSTIDILPPPDPGAPTRVFDDAAGVLKQDVP